MNPTTLSMVDLQRGSGVRARTLRYWIRKRLLPQPQGYGRGARYSREHLLLASFVRQLRNQHIGFSEIRARLSSLTVEQIAASLARTAAPAGTPAPPPEPAYPSLSWEVVQLGDGLVLLVNPRRGPVVRRIAESIYRHYAAVG
jgi:DNA-binding transcriptional MerR regulator